MKAPLPAVTVEGSIDVICGEFGSTSNATGDETSPSGLATVICRVRTELTSLLGIAAVSCPLLTNVVVRGTPLTRPCDAETKLTPLTVRVNELVPTTADMGDKLRMEGPVAAV